MQTAANTTPVPPNSTIRIWLICKLDRFVLGLPTLLEKTL